MVFVIIQTFPVGEVIALPVNRIESVREVHDEEEEVFSKVSLDNGTYYHSPMKVEEVVAAINSLYFKAAGWHVPLDS